MKYLINLPFFSTGILQLGHGLVVFLIVSLDASSHRACMAACSSTTYPCKERKKPPVGTTLKGCAGTRYLHWSNNYLSTGNRREWLQGQVGWTFWEMQNFASKCKLLFSQCIGLDPGLQDGGRRCSRWSMCHPRGPSCIQLQHRLLPPPCSLPWVAGKVCRRTQKASSNAADAQRQVKQKAKRTRSQMNPAEAWHVKHHRFDSVSGIKALLARKTKTPRQWNTW